VIGEHPVVSQTRDFVGAPFSTELAALVAGSLEALNANDAARTALGDAPAAIRDSIQAVFAASDFVAQSCARDTQCFTSLISGGDLQRRLAAVDFAARAPPLPPDPATPEAHFQGELRRWRRRRKEEMNKEGSPTHRRTKSV